MKQPELPVVLASGSPRRKEILQKLGIQFIIDVSDTEEIFRGTPGDTVRVLSTMKAGEVAKRHTDSYVLAADTIVAVEGEILGKPRDRKDAERMLRMLSGRNHSVFTGVCLINTQRKKCVSAVEETIVHFLPISDQAMAEYLATEEPYDKAGAYAIQGRAGVFIDRIEGSYSNVVGLPMHTVTQLFERAANG